MAATSQYAEPLDALYALLALIEAVGVAAWLARCTAMARSRGAP